MTDVSITTAAEPDGAPRIAVLDILRGIAILGILFMNINDMGQSITASFEDIRHLGWSASDRTAWWVREVLANGTARCMLEMLFGAGMVILTERFAERADDRVVMRRYYVRNLVLFLFGLVHVFILLWPGDILHTYGLAALIAFLFRQLRSRWLVICGLNMALIMLLGGPDILNVQHVHAQTVRIEARVAAGKPVSQAERDLLDGQVEARQAIETSRAEERREVMTEDAARTGTFASWARAQWHSFVDIEVNLLEFLFVWEAASVMLIGAALFKLGILQGKRSRRFYVWMTFVAYGAAVPLRILGAFAQTAFDDLDPHIVDVTSEIARQAMTLGHVGLVNLLATSVAGARLLRPFVAAGRTALSIYVAQTLVCLWVLYPPFMLALYGKMTWGPLMATAFVIDAALLWGANLWVRRFDIAPVEWAWRSLIEGERLPWRKARLAAQVLAGDPLPA